MELLAITVCVNYDDILAHVFEQNAQFFSKWFIITSPEDTKTINFIEKRGLANVKLLIFNEFYINNKKFNKGGALLFAQQYIESNYSSANILILDGDIHLPDNFTDKLPKTLENDTIYGCGRTDYWTIQDFITETNPHPKKKPDFQGYFQLYKQDKKYLYSTSYNCSRCDDVFKDKFGTKIFLDICVKHLGKNGPNWNGRDYEVGVF